MNLNDRCGTSQNHAPRVSFVAAARGRRWLDTTIHCRAGGTGSGPTDPSLIRAAVYVTVRATRALLSSILWRFCMGAEGA